MAVKESIEAAFANVPYPGDDNITHCSWKNCPECEDIAAHFRGTSWRDHSLERLMEYKSAITMFTPEAFHYFLPAFLLQSLGHWSKADEIASFIAGQFMTARSDADAGMQQYHAERWAKFNQQQREAIAAYLREFSASDSPFVGADMKQTISRLVANEKTV